MTRRVDLRPGRSAARNTTAAPRRAASVRRASGRPRPVRLRPISAACSGDANETSSHGRSGPHLDARAPRLRAWPPAPAAEPRAMDEDKARHAGGRLSPRSSACSASSSPRSPPLRRGRRVDFDAFQRLARSSSTTAPTGSSWPATSRHPTLHRPREVASSARGRGSGDRATSWQDGDERNRPSVDVHRAGPRRRDGAWSSRRTATSAQRVVGTRGSRARDRPCRSRLHNPAAP